MNRKIFFVLPFILLVSMACSLTLNLPRVPGIREIRGSGNIIKQERSVSDFTQVEMRFIGELFITQGQSESLVIEAEDNILEYITTTVSGGKLTISSEENINFARNEGIKYYLTVKDLDQVVLAGFGDINMDQMITDSLVVRLTGSGNLDLRDLQAESFEVEISGFGSAEVSGKVTDQHVRITGSGDYNCPELASQSARVTLSGFGSATVWASQTLDVTITGSGNVDYYGNPTTTQSITGFGSLNSRGQK